MGFTGYQDNILLHSYHYYYVGGRVKDEMIRLGLLGALTKYGINLFCVSLILNFDLRDFGVHLLDLDSRVQFVLQHIQITQATLERLMGGSYSSEPKATPTINHSTLLHVCLYLDAGCELCSLLLVLPVRSRLLLKACHLFVHFT